MSFVSILPTLLFIALGLVMFGLGLSLTVGDFKRLLQHPRAVVLALVLQVLVLPSACYALIVLLGVAPLYAVGLMLLAFHSSKRGYDDRVDDVRNPEHEREQERERKLD